MKALNNSQANAIGNFSVFWIIFSSGGVFFNSDPVVRYVLVFDVFLIALQISSISKIILLRYAHRCAFVLILFSLVAISVAINSDFPSWLTYARLLVITLLAFGTSVVLSNDAIIERFVQVVVVLAGVSIVLFYTKLVDNNSGLFPTIEFYGNKYVNAFAYLSFDETDRRNRSIFIEPGLYQIYLNMALFVLLYTSRFVRHKLSIITVLLIALYSTNSTTGFISLLLILGGYAFSTNRGNNLARPAVIKIIVSISAISLIYSSDYFKSNIEEKFSGDSQVSLNTRQNSTIIDLLIVQKNPVFGGGVGTYQSSIDSYDSSGLSVDAATNTFSQLGAIFGIPFVILLIWRSWLFFWRLDIQHLSKLILFIVYTISFSTEPFVLYPLFYLPVFMSFKTAKYRQ